MSTQEEFIGILLIQSQLSAVSDNNDTHLQFIDVWVCVCLT